MTLLYHFSEEPGIERFAPRAPLAHPDFEPLVWAIDEWHARMYLFPRDCPRVLLWPLPSTTAEDLDRWFGRTSATMLAHVEWDWYERLRTTTVYRYAFDPTPFEDTGDIGTWVTREPVEPVAVERIDDLPGAMRDANVELRLVPSLAPLAGLHAETTLHWSAVRLRNARDWPGEVGAPSAGRAARLGGER